MSVAEFTVPPVVKTITVRADPERAFNAFTRDFGRWWPLASHHVGTAPAAIDCVIEPRAGGRIFERDAAGQETVWATVLDYEPPHRLALSWFAGKTPDVAQLLELRFTAEGSGTRVELTHSGWEALGDTAQSTRDSYNGGWATVFEQCYGDYANAAAI
jgi:uncharacterized protein YndB with AHSA1/START domain